MERRFIKSGIPGLDEILGGGFLEGSITAVGGPSGSGKSTFGMQFLYNGAYESNEVGVYLCIDESRQDFMFHMSGYKWDIQKAESERKLVFVDYPIHEVDQILGQSSAVADLVNSVGAKRVVIDSVMPVALQYHTEDERKKGFLKLIENIRKWQTTTLIMCEDTTPEAGWELPTSIYGIEKFTDGWIDISYRFDDKVGERRRFIEVLKMKGVSHSMKPYPASINSDGFRVGQGGPKAASPQKPVVEEATLRVIERKPMRKLMMPPPIIPPMQKPRAVKAPPKSAEKTATSKTESDIEAAKATLAAKLAQAKSKIIKKTK